MKQPNGAARLSLDKSFREALTERADRCGKGRREGMYSVSVRAIGNGLQAAACRKRPASRSGN